jgi:hypothetical protein
MSRGKVSGMSPRVGQLWQTYLDRAGTGLWRGERCRAGGSDGEEKMPACCEGDGGADMATFGRVLEAANRFCAEEDGVGWKKTISNRKPEHTFGAD